MRLTHRILAFTLVLAGATTAGLAAQPPTYHIYAGSTHAHTTFTWSHGAQYATNTGCAGILVYAGTPLGAPPGHWSAGYVKSKKNCPTIYVINGWQFPSPNVTLKPDWQKFQGPPALHFADAKAAGYDFYAVTDHSQEAVFNPQTASNPNWMITKKAAAAASDAHFVGLAGFEYSENDGPGGTGHLNVFNSASITNALVPGHDLPHFYQWLEAAAPNGSGPVLASFNHPGPEQYNNWDYRDPKITNIITMLEVINSNKNIHYQGFINALDKGWKVSPVSGLDNHGTGAITKDTSRTFVLATSLTKAAILDAMQHRRTYASLDQDIQCRYTVNGAIMGSTLNRPAALKFLIAINDPDSTNPKDKITKLDIVTNGGVVVATYTPPAPAYSVRWNPTLHNSTRTFYFVRVWNAGGGDAPGADPAKPIAWLAPVWTGVGGSGTH